MDEKMIVQEKKEQGATMLEYALMAALIAIVCIIAVSYLGQQASTTFSVTGSTVASANAGV